MVNKSALRDWFPAGLQNKTLFDILDYRNKVEIRKKKDKTLAYFKKKQYLCGRKRIMEYTKHAFYCIFYYANYAIYV